MTDHTGENVTITVVGGIGDHRALSDALARALAAGRARQSRWQRLVSWLRRCVRG